MLVSNSPAINPSLCGDDCVLRVDGLTKRFGSSLALDGFTMRVPKGSVYGFVGRNGAGKTTLIRLLCGLQRPTSGGFTLFGVRSDDPKIADARRRVGAVVEAPAIYMDLSAEENLKQQFLILGRTAFDEIPDLLRLVGLDDAGKKRARHFSLGMKQRLGIAVALAGRPDFLVLDEPVNGLDPQGIAALRELLSKLNRERGIALLISSHNLHELSRLATHYGIIDRGRMLREFGAGEVDGDLEDYYLSLVGDDEYA